MARNKYPQLLVIREKHSSRNYLISSPEELHRVAVSIIRERAALGYYYATDVEGLIAQREKAIDNLIEKSGVSKDAAPRTPEAVRELMAIQGDEPRTAKLFGIEVSALEAYPAPLKEKAIESARSYIRSLPRVLTDYKQDIDDAENILKIVNTEKAEELEIEHRNRRSNLALWILEARGDYEYEGFEFEDFEPVPSTDELEASRKK